MLDRMRGERDAYSVKLKVLLTSYEKNPTMIFVAFEGEDAKYYNIRIKEATGGATYTPIPCKGKQDVLKLSDRVLSDAKLQNTKIFFFVDRDFDDNSSIESIGNIYLTPCYSIENLYMHESAVREIIISEFDVDCFNDLSELNLLLGLYKEMLSQFIEAITPLNAWIIIQRELEREVDGKIQLSGKSLNKFVKIDLGLVEKIYCIEDMKTIFPKAAIVADDVVNAKIREISSKDKVNYFRGKYFTEFLRNFLELLKTDSKSECPKFFKKKTTKAKIMLTRDNIISELSQYAYTPSCLREFLSKILFLKSNAEVSLKESAMA